MKIVLNVVCVCLCLSTLMVGQAQQQVFTIGTASARPGQKATGFIEIPTGVDPGTRIPVVLIRGSKPGPVLALVSGAHGTEYASIIALEKMISRLTPSEISGTVIIVPLLNVASFEQKVLHVNPVDKKNMNRFFPGKEDGTQTERVSWAITRDVVKRCDYLIDFHSGDLDENLRPIGYWAKTGNSKQDSISREMALAFGIDHIALWPERSKDPNSAQYIDNTALLDGKSAIAVEAGYAGTTGLDDVGLLVNGSLNVMRFLKMLPGDVNAIGHPVWLDRIDVVTSEQTGIFYPVVSRGTYAAAGMKLGYVTDYFGKALYDVRAPEAGVVIYICSVPSMRKGDNVAFIGVISAKTF